MIQSIKNKEELNDLEDYLKKEGTCIWIEDENNTYVFQNGEWIPFEPGSTTSNGEFKMNLYEINKSIISQMESMGETQIQDLKDTINALCDKDYYLLYGKEISYFTLFIREAQNLETLGDVVIDCLNSFHEIKTFEVMDNNAIEIWVTVKMDDEENTSLPTVLYLFDYTEGVVNYG